jgi:hypothetical protein
MVSRLAAHRAAANEHPRAADILSVGLLRRFDFGRVRQLFVQFGEFQAEFANHRAWGLGREGAEPGCLLEIGAALRIGCWCHSRPWKDNFPRGYGEPGDSIGLI